MGTAETFPRVIVVGERFNLGRTWRPKNAARETDLRFLLRLGAFREGAGRARLNGCGITWSASMNLLMPDAPGAWDAARAREVAAAVREGLEARADLIVLAGRKVAVAFGLSKTEPMPFSSGAYLVVPHPSGKCHLWNPGAPVREAVRAAYHAAWIKVRRRSR